VQAVPEGLAAVKKTLTIQVRDGTTGVAATRPKDSANVPCNRFESRLLMAQEESSQQLDLSKIDLPSDQITMGTVRRVEPTAFEPYISHEPDDLGIIDTVATEILLAKDAYTKARGIKSEIPMDAGERRQYILNLNDEYRAYGISTGVKQTNELIRNMERAAVAQAKQSNR
jgi:hypothetical protein